MNRNLHRTVLALLGVTPLAGLAPQAMATGITADITAAINDAAGYVDASARPAYVWDGGNIGYGPTGAGDCVTNDCANLPAIGHARVAGSDAMSGSVESDRNLGWNHTTHWYTFHITTAGGYTISMDRVSSDTSNQPALSIWSSGANQWDAAGSSHKFNQVAAPGPSNSNAYMQTGGADIADFVGYANSGPGYTNADGSVVLGALTKGSSSEGPLKDSNVAYNALTNPYTSIVSKGSYTNPHAGMIAAPYAGTGSSVNTSNPTLDNAKGGGHAELSLWLPAGWYVMTGGGSCADFTCTPTAKADSNYRIKILSNSAVTGPAASPTPSPKPSPSSSPTPSPSASPAPTPLPTATPLPSPSPAPSGRPTPPPNLDCGGNPPPVLDSVAPSFDATVGEELSFAVTAIDYCDETITVKALQRPKGVDLSAQDFDANNKWAATFRWTPSAKQANKKYRVTFAAFQTQKHGKKSAKLKTVIRVWPAGTNAGTGSVGKLAINRAQWNAAKSELLLVGKAKFSTLLSPGERSALLTEKVQITDGSGASIGEGNIKASGKWTLRITGLTEATVPCIVDAAFGGQTAHRDVKKAPASCGR